MRLTVENKLKITQSIRAAAAKTFRENGYDGVNLDKLMNEAGLTRGAFYSHYKSKAELFAAVMRDEHPVLHMLKRRDETSATGLYNGVLSVFEEYLNPANLDEIFSGCSLAALTGDTTRADINVRRAFGEAFMAVCTEMARGQDQPIERYGVPLLLAAGAVRTAKAMAEEEMRVATLNAASTAFIHLLPTPNGA